MQSEPVIPPGLVGMIGQEMRAAHADNVATSHTALEALLTKVMEEHEQDLASFVAPLLAHVADHPDVPDVVRQALGILVAPEHQTQFFTAIFAVRAIIDQFVFAAIAPLVQDVSNAVWPHSTNIPLSQSEAAVAVVKGHLDEGAAEHEAALTGLSASRFRTMVANTGNPPGIVQLQEAYRRGFIGADDFEKGVRQSNVRNEWTDLLLKMRYVPVPIGEVLAGVVQGHLSHDDAAHRISLAGIDPANFPWLYETHGRPPGVVELGHLVNRGEMSEADWEQAVRESDIKNKYIPFLAKLHRQIMPMRTVVSAIRQGVLPATTGVRKLRELGYNAEDAATLASEATATKHQHTRDLTEAQITNLYLDHLIPKPRALLMLGGLGLDADEANMILSLADHAREARAQQAAITRVKNQYVAHHITKAVATKRLAEIDMDTAAITSYLDLWTIERTTNVRTLTEAQLGGLLYRKQIDTDEFLKRVEALGYSEADAKLLYWLAFPPTHQPKEGP